MIFIGNPCVWEAWEAHPRRDRVRVVTVKGHATDADIASGLSSPANWFGNETDNFWKAQLWSEDWKDRAKAIVFDGQLATIQEVTDSVHGRLTRSTPSAVAG